MSVARPGAGPASTLALSPNRFPWVRLTVTAWALVAGIILLRGLITPRDHSTYSCFVGGAQDWRAGKELYQSPGETCRYSPLFHVFMVPFDLVPERVGSTVWRLLNWGAFLAGLLLWRKTFLPGDLTARELSLLFLFLLPLSIGSLNNAQANPLILGLMLIGVSAVVSQGWSLAGACLAAAILIKLYPLALALLLIPLYPRRFTVPFLFWLALGLGLPYLLREPGYITRQYSNWYHVLKIDDRSQINLAVSYRDLWLLIRLIGQPISHDVYHLLQLADAAAIAGLCWLRRPADSTSLAPLHWTLELACIWMTVFGPATESCTYILLGPTLAWRLVEAWFRSSSGMLRGLVTASGGLFLLSQTSNWFPFGKALHSLGLQPLAGLFLLGALLLFPPSLPKVRSTAQPMDRERSRMSA